MLAGRKTAGEVSGLVLVGGKPPSRMFMRRFTGYVEQFGAQFLHRSMPLLICGPPASCFLAHLLPQFEDQASGCHVCMPIHACQTGYTLWMLPARLRTSCRVLKLRHHLVMSACGQQCCCCADTLVENLTVREMLAYTAELKLELDFGTAEKKQRVELLIDALALESCQNVRIGSAMQRGISGAWNTCMPAVVHRHRV